jgi:hypothetical protein
MSSDSLVGVHGKLPTEAALRKRLGDLGNLTGDWKRGFEVPGSGSFYRETGAEIRAVFAKKTRKPLTAIVRICQCDFMTEMAIANAIAATAGGVMLTEDYAEAFPLEATKPAKPAKTKRDAIDVTVPPEAKARLAQVPWLTSSRKHDYAHVLYRLAPRRQTKLTWAKIIGAFAERPYAKFSPGAHDVNAEISFGQIKIEKLVAKYPYWHITKADDDQWDAALAAMCAVARATSGVLYKDGDPAARIDFAPDEPLPKVLSEPSLYTRFTRRAPDEAALVMTYDRVRLRWSRLDGDHGEDDVQIGKQRAHPMLETLHGTRVGDVVLVDIVNFPNTEKLLPPAPSRVHSRFALEVLEKLATRA